MPRHSPPAMQNAPGCLTPPALASRRWKTSSAIYDPASATSDRCVPPPIRLLARWCQSWMLTIRQLPTIRHAHSHLNTNMSIAYTWSRSCNSSFHQCSQTTQRTGKRPHSGGARHQQWSMMLARAHEQRKRAAGRRTSQWMRAATARTASIAGMQTFLERGDQTRPGAHDCARLRDAQRSRPAAPSQRSQ